MLTDVLTINIIMQKRKLDSQYNLGSRAVYYASRVLSNVLKSGCSPEKVAKEIGLSKEHLEQLKALIQ